MTTPVVLVTGALTGIGRATAQAFAREGSRVVVSGRRDDEGLN
jgi:NAD(P)-dependent dehydrogenase (short-subunit alcohol dehydrogenase family)